MYVYIKIGDVWEAGFYLTKYSYDGTSYNQFMSETRWANEWAAAARVNYLNGGTGAPPITPVPKQDDE
ncbi:MAG: hypothetical protein QF828_09365 [Pseudomonadales bacterium]|nr:hypothetical protein [Pseudomonadales bacterium]